MVGLLPLCATTTFDGELLTMYPEVRERLQRFNAELEGKVAQRTAELAARNREIQALLESIPDMVLRLHRDGRRPILEV